MYSSHNHPLQRYLLTAGVNRESFFSIVLLLLMLICNCQKLWCLANAYAIPQTFVNIMNRDIPWPRIPEDMNYEAYDLIDKRTRK
ncbi:hypothetical protein L6452_00611 [Arctium lappa]|uniref:Uncharacterized protein n=1 Tax=Arctium lappa TaxID=4217 RepID=A0ACB9FF74_ARCLA|nr:hypothetical protein L6452_00611 [Arctium lappa]